MSNDPLFNKLIITSNVDAKRSKFVDTIGKVMPTHSTVFMLVRLQPLTETLFL